MEGLQNTPAESPHHTAPLPESFHKSHSSSDALPEVYQPYECYPEAVYPDQTVEQQRDNAKRVTVSEKEASAATGAISQKPSRVCGLRRRTFVVVLVGLVVIVAIIGGVAGGVLGSRRSSSSTQDDTSPPADGSTGSVPGQNQTVAENTTAATLSPMRAIAASEYDVTLFLVWQVPNGDLHMHSYYNGPGAWVGPTRLELDTPAIDNTPLAVLTWQDDDQFEVLVRYFTTTANTIGTLSFQCRANGTSCTAPQQLSASETNHTAASAAGTGLALVAPAFGLVRSYQVDADGTITQASLSTDLEGPSFYYWGDPTPLSNGATAHPASPIAATMVHDETWLFWFAADRQLQYATSTYSTLTWSAGELQNITAPLPASLPRALAISRSDTPDSTQVFYLDGPQMQTVQFSNQRWTVGDFGPSMPNASVADGPMAAVGWNATATRIYFLVDGDGDGGEMIREVASETAYGEWLIGGMEGLEYD